MLRPPGAQHQHEAAANQGREALLPHAAAV